MKSWLKTLLCVVTLLWLSACGSKEQLARKPVPEVTLPTPPAWTMEPASNSVQKLDSLFGISASPSSEIKPSSPTFKKSDEH